MEHGNGMHAGICLGLLACVELAWDLRYISCDGVLLDDQQGTPLSFMRYKAHKDYNAKKTNCEL